METTANKCKTSKLTFQNDSNKVSVLNALLVLLVTNELNHYFSIRKNTLHTNSHRHQGLHLSAHQLKTTPLQCWRSHWGACRWTLSHHLRICPGGRWPSCRWWWSVPSGSAGLKGTQTQGLVRGKHLPTLLPTQLPTPAQNTLTYSRHQGTKLVKRTELYWLLWGKKPNKPSRNQS